ncbi:ATPase [Xylaria bambusicola]|uniref:ATPase n=1 Tax=Xylaria bambusicola TaxID=326684 RepID=UPI00200727FC|nr:ATPase [Xylaria bambusicola]KAI0527945.1 ATPase [Xylaria bambusicola]
MYSMNPYARSISPSRYSNGLQDPNATNPGRCIRTSQPKLRNPPDNTNAAWFSHSSAKRINTDTFIAESLARQYPTQELVIAPHTNNLSLLNYARAGNATCSVVVKGPGGENGGIFTPLTWTEYVPPLRRIDGDQGMLNDTLKFAIFQYQWRDYNFTLYVVDGRDGAEPYGGSTNQYILTDKRASAEALLVSAGSWANELHEEVWVFDQGYWEKSTELFQSVLGASWDKVILDKEIKKAIIEDPSSFFESRDTYDRLKVPWKRGVIFYGPPGNGKTISIKATMHMLHERKQPVPTLYVRSLFSYGGPERALGDIFKKARQYAPCYLVFEDLDSIVSDGVRSYFLNEVDGLKANDGIFMVGSTNHLDRLDPGISKRPSRFDRKYYFPDPNKEQRVAYCKFWQGKLADNKDIEFPDELCEAIADITGKFSFAYMQEAFVAALLAIARRTERSTNQKSFSKKLLKRENKYGWVVCNVSDDEDDMNDSVRSSDSEDDLDSLVLWVEIKKQIATLREGMDSAK